MLKILDKLDKDETRNPYHFSTLEFKTKKSIDYSDIKLIFKCFEDEDTYGKIVRGKGILQNRDKNWYKFDYVENEADVLTSLQKQSIADYGNSKVEEVTIPVS